MAKPRRGVGTGKGRPGPKAKRGKPKKGLPTKPVKAKRKPPVRPGKLNPTRRQDRKSVFTKELIQFAKAEKREATRRANQEFLAKEGAWEKRDARGRYIPPARKDKKTGRYIKGAVREKPKSKYKKDVKRLEEGRFPYPDEKAFRKNRVKGKYNYRYSWQFKGSKSIPDVERLLETLAYFDVGYPGKMKIQILLIPTGKFEHLESGFVGSHMMSAKAANKYFVDYTEKPSVRDALEEVGQNFQIHVIAWTSEPPMTFR